jgi:ribosomal protein S18 acetylase RimI-like enzyme
MLSTGVPHTFQPTATHQHPPASLRRATIDDVAPLAVALAAAFNDDPVFERLLPNERTRGQGLRRYFRVELRAVGLARGSVWTTDDLAGAAISTGPGMWRMPPRALLLHGPAFSRAFGLRVPRAATLLARVESRHVRGPHHYFAAIGVAPQRQGHGLGRALMAPTMGLCDQAGLPAYLEASSERNAALYERLGFRVVGELQYGGSQPLRLMLRAPHANQEGAR